MPTTLAALSVILLAVLPGAAYTFAYEARAGAFNVSAPDRIIRFLAASAILHVLAVPVTYHIYRTEVRSDRLANGDTSLMIVQTVALLYVGLPILLGLLVGTGQRRGWMILKDLTPRAPEPKAWDFLFRQDPPALIRIKLKSGAWIAGVFGQLENGEASFASCYPEEGDLYLVRAVEVDPATGEFQTSDGVVAWKSSGLLVRWSEVEYLEVTKRE